MIWKDVTFTIRFLKVLRCIKYFLLASNNEMKLQLFRWKNCHTTVRRDYLHRFGKKSNQQVNENNKKLNKLPNEMMFYELAIFTVFLVGKSTSILPKLHLQIHWSWDVFFWWLEWSKFLFVAKSQKRPI
jgi:hypothetical protein